MPGPESPLASADLLAMLRSGNEAAAEAVFERYAQRLIQLARGRLSSRMAARVDAEDVVQSAWRSFFVAAREGRFAIEQGGDLWRLLVEVTLHKLYRQAARHQAQRRSVAREQAGSDVNRAIAPEPTPEDAVAAAEELDGVMQQLSERGRAALALRLQGYEHQEIARQLGASERTVRRLLADARRIMAARAGGDFIPSAARRGAGNAAVPRRIPAEMLRDATLPWTDFLLREQIGAGASGKVYRASQRSNGRDVAIKFLRRSLTDHPPAVERFLREARTVRELAHPGIVAVSGAGRTPGGGLFLQMELVTGLNLEQICRTQAVSPGQAAQWVAQAARIMHFAHTQGVIHCDLKPSNLLLDEAGALRVTDFGLAVANSQAGNADARFAGTPAFMAPEQVDSAWGNVSPLTDVYGLGGVLCYLLFGRPPHVADSLAHTLTQVADAAPILIPTTANVSQELLDVVRTCLAKQPAIRPQGAAALAERLEALAGRASGG
jgi:RNA polymerase sigma factor (sigma-70 family)